MIIIIQGQERQVLTISTAKAQGFSRFTNGYNIPGEYPMLEAVVKDADQAHGEIVLVQAEDPHRKSTKPWLEVWIKRQTTVTQQRKEASSSCNH